MDRPNLYRRETAIYVLLLRGDLPRGDIKMNSLKIPRCRFPQTKHDDDTLICQDPTHYLRRLDYDPSYETEYVSYDYYPSKLKMKFTKKFPILNSLSRQNVEK